MAGKITGVAIAPGVSKNGRLYTRSNIEKAYRRMADRLADPAAPPINMRTHHAAGDDSTRIAAQVTAVALREDGAITYEAAPVGTAAAKDIGALTRKHPVTGKPSVAVSISGWWLGDPRTVDHDGQTAETADDLEINALDFTANPGVTGASAASETAATRVAISESYEAEVQIMDDTTETTVAVSAAEAMRAVHEAATKKEPYGDVKYADPGYQDDGKKRYPLDTEKHVRSAWAYINQADNARLYKPNQLKAVKGRIKAAAKKYDIQIQDTWLYAGQQITEATDVAEFYAVTDIEYGSPAGTFCFNATNGPISITVSSYCIDPADLEVVTKAACDAITVALRGLDPDMDGDIDLPGAPGEDTDHDADEAAGRDTSGGDQMETAPTTAPVAETTQEDTVQDTDTTTEGAATTETAPAAQPARLEIDYKALAEAVIAAQHAANANGEAPAEETAPAADAPADTATPDQGQLREAMKDVVRELLTESGTVKPGRKGYALAEQTEAGPDVQELWDKRGALFVAAAREARQLGLDNR